MKTKEESLSEYLKQLKIKEEEFTTKVGRPLSAIAQALYNSNIKPDKADWQLLFKISELYKDKGFKFEHFKESKKPKQKAPTSIPPKLDMTVDSPELEEFFKLYVGNRLKKLRKTRGITVADMNKMLGTNTSNYSALETGRSHLSCYRLHLISQFLGVPYSAIINISGSEQESSSLQLAIEQKNTIITSLKKHIKSYQDQLEALLAEAENKDKIKKD